MPGYIITNAEVFDKDAYGEYGKLALDAIAKYGGEFLTRGRGSDTRRQLGTASHRRGEIRQRRTGKGNVQLAGISGRERKTHRCCRFQHDRGRGQLGRRPAIHQINSCQLPSYRPPTPYISIY